MLILAVENSTKYKIVNKMKRFVTHSRALKFTFFSVVILFGMLALDGTSALATNRNETSGLKSNAIHVNSQSGDRNNLSGKNKSAGVVAGVNVISIAADAAANVKITTATLGATITPSDAVITERGIVWSTVPGVTINDNKIVEGGVTGGSYTIDVTGLTRSKTIFYKGYYTDANGTFLSSELSFSNVPVFTGTGTWDDVTKWNVNEMPLNLSGDSVVIDGTCTTNDLTINTGAKVTVNAARVLNVNGAISNTSSESLLIKADPAAPNGTLTYLYGLPKATVEMYSKASWDLNQAVGSKYSWQFFGIPVKSISFASTFTDCFVRQHDETSPNVDGLWIDQSGNATLSSGTGYEVVQQKPKIYVFKGDLTNKNFSQSLTYTPASGFAGQHILGNPYTAAIDIKNIQFGVNTEEAIYLYNTGTYNQWLTNGGNLSSGTSYAPGQYTVSTKNSVGELGVPTQIPSMQGFLVNVIANAGNNPGSILIPYNSTNIINNTEKQRAPGVKNSTSPEKVVTRIDLSGNQSVDCMWIFTDESCTPMFDNGWDGRKMKGSIQSPQLYAMEPGGDFQIDGVSDINGTYLGFTAGLDTDYKLTFTHKNTDVKYTSMFLVDLLENITTDITASGSEYTFTSLPSTTTVKRFKIVAGSEVNTKNQTVNSFVKVLNSNGTISIQNLTGQQGNFVLYNMNGVEVKRMVFKANDITTFSTMNLVSGAYVAKVCTNREMVTEKIIIR